MDLVVSYTPQLGASIKGIVREVAGEPEAFPFHSVSEGDQSVDLLLGEHGKVERVGHHGEHGEFHAGVFLAMGEGGFQDLLPSCFEFSIGSLVVFCPVKYRVDMKA